MGQILTTIAGLTGGVVGVTGTTKRYRIALQSTWAVNEKVALVFTASATAGQETIGAGSITGKTPAFCLTLKRKEYIACAATLFFSGVDSPLVFNSTTGLGNGNIEIANNFAMSEDLQSFAPYQGKVAVFGRSNIQIWQVDVDPGAYQQLQVLDNIGTVAPKSVKSFGELDVFFLHDTGVRSLRARDSSSNASTVDIGSAIDSLVKAKLASCTATEKAAACGVIDPNNGQYWLCVKDTLYVLSLFPSAKISAWSTWDCSYQSGSVTNIQFTNSNVVGVVLKYSNTTDEAQATSVSVGATSSVTIPPVKQIWVYTAGGVLIETYAPTAGLSFSGQITLPIGAPLVVTSNQTAFVPQDIVNYNGQIFVSTSEGFYVYGGAGNVTYDNTICVAETSWLDFDTPAVQKSFSGVDVAQEGSWNHYACPDYLSQTPQTIMLAQDNPTFAGGKIGWTNTGSHVKFRSQSYGDAERCVLSNILIHYKGNQSSK